MKTTNKEDLTLGAIVVIVIGHVLGTIVKATVYVAIGLYTLKLLGVEV
jgi:uncharacterized membrane protein (Fun14 family)